MSTNNILNLMILRKMIIIATVIVLKKGNFVFLVTVKNTKKKEKTKNKNKMKNHFLVRFFRKIKLK